MSENTYDVYVSLASASKYLEILDYDVEYGFHVPRTWDMKPTQTDFRIPKSEAVGRRRDLIAAWEDAGKTVKGVQFLPKYVTELFHKKFSKGEPLESFSDYGNHVKAGGFVLVDSPFITGQNTVYTPKQAYSRPWVQVQSDIEKKRLFKAVRIEETEPK